MITSPHYQAMILSLEAAALVKQDEIRAQELFAQAAELEKTALESIEPDKVRTKSIIAVSYVALLYKANKLTEAKTAAQELLETNLNSWAKIQLSEILNLT